MRVPIGTFSKMARLSVKALRLYDENGLLPPAFVDPSTGYRYYELEQARRAEVIKILRSVEMPLAEILELVEADDNAAMTERLLMHKQRLADRLAAHQRMLASVESILQNKQRVLPYDVQLMETVSQTVAAVRFRTAFDQIARNIAHGFETLVRGLSAAQVPPSGAPMLVYHDVIDEESDGNIEICVPIANDFSVEADVYGRELEGGTMAAALHRGPYEELTPAYHVVTGWIVENGYEIGGPPREVYLNDPRTVAREELLTRVEFPICSGSSGE